MEYKIKITGDGSFTLFTPDFNENYHSINGAVQESMHVFINAGLKMLNLPKLKIFEMGFGTGLNALLTLLNSANFQQIEYYTIDSKPLGWKLVSELHYVQFLNGDSNQNIFFEKMHNCPWNEKTVIGSNFSLFKIKGSIVDLEIDQKFDLVYFDAFSPAVQPELWTGEIFQKICNLMNPGALLTTYSAKGAVRRAMQNCSLKVDRLSGPPGKREMLRAMRSED